MLVNLSRSGRRPERRHIFIIGILLAIAGFFSGGCPPKFARVQVSSGDLVRANAASLEADAYFHRKDYYAALIKYLEASRLNPNSEIIYNKLGITYSQLKYYDDAIRAFQRAIWLNSKYAYSINNLGSVYFARRDLKKAESLFKKAISMKEEASFHINLGSLYLERKKLDKAMAEWRKGLALNPDALTKGSAVSLNAPGDANASKERSYFLARLFASSGDVEKAIENLKEALANGFSDMEAIQKEHDFDRIRQDERFLEFMKTASAMLSKIKQQ